jgi:CelD/BcsL family acetyltransferase involved in cellulose biosynthesis
MKVKIVDTVDDFDALEKPWETLAENSPSSVFSSYDYVRTAWRHFHKPSDQLFLLSLYDGPSLVGIAPLYIRRKRMHGIPVRIIRFISTWQGDRPTILSKVSKEAAWRNIMAFLESTFRDWEVLDLVEQPAEGPEGSGWSFLFRSGWYWESSPGVAHSISLTGSWEDYVHSLSDRTRKDWNRLCRKLSSTPGGYSVEWITDSGRIRDALSRFVVLEKSGWKADAGVGLAKDERHLAFYEDLLLRLAEKGQALVGFLKTGGVDIAGVINFLHQDVIVGRHTTYSQKHKEFSPGMLLHAEVTRYGFQGSHREIDLGNEGSYYKGRWANMPRELVHWKGYRVRSRILPLIAVKKLKHKVNHLRRVLPVSIRSGWGKHFPDGCMRGALGPVSRTTVR